MTSNNTPTPAQSAETAIAKPATPLEERWKFSQAISRSNLIPKAYQGSPENVFVAMTMAEHMHGMDVFFVMQHYNVIQGRGGWSAAAQIALANMHGPFTGPIQYDVTGSGEKLAVTASGTLASGHIEARTASMEMAKAEGWTKNPKYKSMPEHMLRLRSATLLIRSVCPEVTMGAQSIEEVEDVMYATGRGVGGAEPPSIAGLRQATAALESADSTPEEPKVSAEANPPEVKMGSDSGEGLAF